MKALFLIVIVGLLPFFTYAQADSLKLKDFSIQDLITIDTVNNHDVFSNDSFNIIVQRKLKQIKPAVKDYSDYPKVYFTNRNRTKFFEIWGGPDLGYGWFYVIGYTKNKKCIDCGTYLGSTNDPDFIIDQGIKLGDNLNEIWPKVHLQCFRNFSFKGIKYFYFEKGKKQDLPPIPYKIFFYKFKDEKLIEIGFGYGMMGENPILNTQ